MALPVDVDVSANQSGIGAISPAPQGVADHYDFVPSRLFFLREESTTASQRDTEEGEEVGRDARAAKALRLSVASQITFPGPQSGHLPEHGIGFAPFQVSLDGNRQAGELTAPRRYHNLYTVDFVGMGIGKRLQQYCMDDTENRRIDTATDFVPFRFIGKVAA